jgi:hypothetical protein
MPGPRNALDAASSSSTESSSHHSSSYTYTSPPGGDDDIRDPEAKKESLGAAMAATTMKEVIVKVSPEAFTWMERAAARGTCCSLTIAAIGTLLPDGREQLYEKPFALGRCHQLSKLEQDRAARTLLPSETLRPTRKKRRKAQGAETRHIIKHQLKMQLLQQQLQHDAMLTVLQGSSSSSKAREGTADAMEMPVPPHLMEATREEDVKADTAILEAKVEAARLPFVSQMKQEDEVWVRKDWGTTAKAAGTPVSRPPKPKGWTDRTPQEVSARQAVAKSKEDLKRARLAVKAATPRPPPPRKRKRSRSREETPPWRVKEEEEETQSQPPSTRAQRKSHKAHLKKKAKRERQRR